MAKVGSWGKDIIFNVSDKRILTPSSLDRSSSSRWASHDIIGGKPKGEFLGPGTDQINLDIILDVNLGVSPIKVIEKLRNAKDLGTVNILIIGSYRFGKYKWAITDMSDSWDTAYSQGQLAKAKVTLTLKEYR